MVRKVMGVEVPDVVYCPKCGSKMVRFYIAKYEGSRTVGWESVGFYCKNCGTSISDVEYVKLKRMGKI